MTIRIALFLLLFITFLIGAPIQERKIERKALVELLETLEIPTTGNLIEQTQKRWLRASGKERWEMAELPPEKRKFVLGWAEEQGLYSPWTPAFPMYDDALILGATTSRMETRLQYLVKLWEEGTRFHQIVWLTGDRPLDPRIDGYSDLCANESEAARLIWNEANLPQELRNLPVLFVAVPMKTTKTGLQRPNTQDTIVAWLKEVSSERTALFVSDQPFCGYQYAIVKHCLPDSIHFDLVGPGVDPYSHPLSAAITLDTLARWIYAEGFTLSTMN